MPLTGKNTNNPRLLCRPKRLTSRLQPGINDISEIERVYLPFRRESSVENFHIYLQSENLLYLDKISKSFGAEVEALQLIYIPGLIARRRHGRRLSRND